MGGYERVGGFVYHCFASSAGSDQETNTEKMRFKVHLCETDTFSFSCSARGSACSTTLRGFVLVLVLVLVLGLGLGLGLGFTRFSVTRVSVYAC